MDINFSTVLPMTSRIIWGPKGLLAAAMRAVTLIKIRGGGSVASFIGLVGLGFVFIGFPIFLVFMILRAKKEGKRNALLFQASQAVYELALDHLARNPQDPKARVKALEAGREYYGYINPDTQTVRDGIVIATRDNAAAREAKIQSDIEARIGHLKVAS